MRRISAISLLLLALFTAPSLYAVDGGKKKKKSKPQKELSEKEEIALKNYFIEANKEKMLNNDEKAIELFEKCIMIDDGHSASYYELASIMLKRKQNQLALEYMLVATASEPDNKWYLQLLGYLYETNKQYDKSAETYQHLIELHPNQIGYYESLANAFLYQNDLKSATKVYDQMEDIFGVLEFTSTQKQKIYISQKKVDKAIIEAEKLIETYPSNPGYYNGLAEIYSASGQKDKAMETYQKLLEIDPDNAYVQLSMSIYYFEAGETEKAEESMRIAFRNPSLDFNSKARILFNDIAYNNVEQGKVNPFALELSKILEETHPENAKVYAVSADLLYQTGDKKGALKAYEKSLAKDENQFLIWSQILLLYSENEQWDSIYQKSNAALELFPNQPTIYYFNGISAIYLKNYDEAIDALETGKDFVIDNNNLLGQFYTNLADAYNSLEQYEKSDASFEKALEINPNDYLVLNNYSYYLSLRGEKLDRASEMAKQVVDRHPNSATYLDTYAWVLYKKGDYDGAKKYMEHAINSGGDSESTLIEHYGDILYQLKDIEGAMKYWKKAQQMGGASDLLDKKIETKQLHE